MTSVDLVLGLFTLFVVVSTVFLVSRTRRAQRPRCRRLGVVASSVAVGLTLSLFAGLGFRFWYYHRQVPPPVRQALFEGVTYIRDIRQTPRPLVINVLTIDLAAPGLSFLVTPGQPTPGKELRARTVSQFVEEFGVQLAINGNDFEPWFDHTLLDYYPHVGDPVDVRGVASSRGDVYSTERRGLPTLYLSASNAASFGTPVGSVYNAVSGLYMILKDGQWVDPGRLNHDPPDALDPRTAIGLDKSGHTLILIVVDGRQPNYSEGVTIRELSDIAAQFGADSAMNMDGGGSSTMVIAGESGKSLVLNSPIDSEIPGRERAVANQLGIFARALN